MPNTVQAIVPSFASHSDRCLTIQIVIMVNCVSILIRLVLVVIIIGTMVIWAIQLAHTLNSWPDTSDDSSHGINGTRLQRYELLRQKLKVFYITNTCIPELFAIIAVIGVLSSSKYWSLACGLVLAIFWINDHQRDPTLFYYGTPLQISCHALHLSIWTLLLLFGSLQHTSWRSSKLASNAEKPSVMVNNLNSGPYLQYPASKYIV